MVQKDTLPGWHSTIVATTKIPHIEVLNRHIAMTDCQSTLDRSAIEKSKSNYVEFVTPISQETIVSPRLQQSTDSQFNHVHAWLLRLLRAVVAPWNTSCILHYNRVRDCKTTRFYSVDVNLQCLAALLWSSSLLLTDGTPEPAAGSEWLDLWSHRESTETKRYTDCTRNVAAVVPEDVVTKESVSKALVSKDTTEGTCQNLLSLTQKVAWVSKGRSGGSAQVKVKRRELQMQSADSTPGGKEFDKRFSAISDFQFWISIF